MFNINQFLKQAQSMQQKMQEVQDDLVNTNYEAHSGGGLVKITINGKGEIKKISIDPSLLKVEEQEMLEDLIVAACADAKQKSDNASKESMDSALGGMNLPPNFKMPF